MKAMKVMVGEERQEEKEMELLLSEIPHVTSPQGHGGQGHGAHGAAHHHGHAVRHGDDTYYALLLNHGHGHGHGYNDDGGHHGGMGGGGHGSLSGGSTPSPASSPLSSCALSPSSPGDDAGRHWLANKLHAVRLGDVAAAAEVQAVLPPSPAPAIKNSPADVSAALRANYGYNFGMPGCSVHQEPLFLDPSKAAYIARSQRCSVDAGLDGFGGFPRSLDGGVGGMVYHRTGGGGGQGLVHPALAEALLLSRQAGGEHKWEDVNVGPVDLGGRGGLSKLGYSVPLAADRYTLLYSDARSRHDEIKAFRCEDSLIIDGKKVHCVGKQALDGVKEKRLQQQLQQLNDKTLDLDSPKMLKYENMIGVRGYIYFMARDQHGCRFLQQKFDEGKQHVDVIFEGVIGHIAELMINPFGNYLVQKLLEVCDEEQRLKIIVVLTEDPAKLLKISLNTHGTRAVQKLIETVESRQQIVLIVSALRPGFMHLVKDLNGNHVMQKCLANFGAEENKFIFDAAATHCFEMAIHRHGCCVLQRCISSSRGEYRAKLIAEICANGFQLAQDPFGNYVVQYVLDLKIPSASANLAAQFEGSYVYLSKQKVSSNVVEKCLKVFSEEDKAAIIFDLISVSHFEQLLQDPFANYVIHTALLNSKGPLRNALVEAIRPHEEALRTSPCCKRISRALSRG